MKEKEKQLERLRNYRTLVAYLMRQEKEKKKKGRA